MQEFFGEVINGKVILSDSGKIVSEEWIKTGEMRKNVKLDEWIVMPNHIHGIIELKNNNFLEPLHHETPQRGVSTAIAKNWKPNSLGSIINQFKSACTKRIWRSGFIDFKWQSRFYDRIIRDENALGKIREYIQRNPTFWNEDKNKVENIFY